MTDLEKQLMRAVRTGIAMRAAQVAYFAAPRQSERKPLLLQQSKDLERDFDRLAKHVTQSAHAVP